MKREIDQRDENALRINCNCGGSHSIEFSYSDDKEYKDYWISFLEPYGDYFFTRVWTAITYVFKRRNIYHSSSGMTAEDLKKIIEHMNKYIAIT